MCPIVLVFAVGGATAKDISENIIKAQGGQFISRNLENYPDSHTGYECNLKTKYYENTIILLPIEGDIDAVYPDILQKTEAIVAYFGPNSKQYKQTISDYYDFLKSKNIRHGVILLDHNKFSEDITLWRDTQTYTSSLFDFVELNAIRSNADEDLGTLYDYEAVLQTMYSFGWSNINIQKRELAKPVPGEPPSSSNFEADIDNFENLLSNFKAFKSLAVTLNREEVLDHAERMATQFIELMNSGDDC